MWQPGLGSQGVSRAQSTWVFLVGKTAGQRVRSRYAASPGMGSVQGRALQGRLLGGGARSEEECQAGWREASWDMSSQDQKLGPDWLSQGCPPQGVPRPP